jgi:hypothetical protein
MKILLSLFLFISLLHSNEVALYATVGVLSHHFNTDANKNKFNQEHDAFGAEAVFDGRYTLTYLHFNNSRNKTTNIAAVGYRYDFIDSFGLYSIIGYQKGYCFDNLKSVECTEEKDNSGIAFLPMLYYRHKYFILDFMTQGNMVALKLNIKLYPY